MKVEKLFDGEGHFIHYRHVEVRTEDPYAKQPDIHCLGCGEYLEIADRATVELMSRRLVGIVCPKCGKEQAAGPVSRFSMVELGTGASTKNSLCRAAAEEAEHYWRAEPQLRMHKYRWLDDHAMVCAPCALLLEKAHARAIGKARYEECRGPKDWSPRAEMPPEMF